MGEIRSAIVQSMNPSIVERDRDRDHNRDRLRQSKIDDATTPRS
jgi:hypothetical protein